MSAINQLGLTRSAPWQQGVWRDRDLGSAPVVVALVVLALVFQALNGAFLSPDNLVNLTLQSATTTGAEPRPRSRQTPCCQGALRVSPSWLIALMTTLLLPRGAD